MPIKIGGYKNATNTQVQTATTCAAALRDLIGPYLLRRMKIDVKSDLPKKEEKVLFCDLTKKQHADYINYLKSPQVRQLLDGGRNVLAGIDKLKKICNHPDLFDREYLESVSFSPNSYIVAISMLMPTLDAQLQLREGDRLRKDDCD